MNCKTQSATALRRSVFIGAAIFSFLPKTFAVDIRVDSWITNYSGKYARIYQTDADLAAGVTKTTWSINNLSQSLPAYSGVQEIYSSTNWVYIRSTGLGNHTMGPWYNNASRSALFVNVPVNQKVIYRFPRTSVVPATRSLVGGGDIGFFVDGVDGFDSRDATSYSNASGVDGDPPGMTGVTGDGIWNRDAYVNEAITFDPALAHQQNTGVYHYHANPIATRYLLGDHVDFSATTKMFSENTNAPTHHSPIVGWMKDGFPLYGPYGYSNATNTTSDLRRMRTGYVPRNGSSGTTNLATIGRTTLPAWAARANNRSSTLTSGQYGPAVSTSFPLGRYIEDNDFLGDLGKTQGENGDFDLDEYNGRFCVTPEFPEGTYTYFVTITSNGLPTYPYNIGRQYYGTPSGGTVTTISENVTTNFLGGTNLLAKLSAPSLNASNSTVTLVWSAVEGGTYVVQASTNFSDWNNRATNLVAGIIAQTNLSRTNLAEFYRLNRTAVANFDSLGAISIGGGNGIPAVAPGGSGSRGTTATITITLPRNPPQPPIDKTPTSVTLGSISGTSISRPDLGTVLATFVIPANATTGPQNIVITFNPAPTYTMTGVFTIN